MRIQNNIMALNTHRQYTINNDNVSKSAEKLSSGYRINRAGDDAAGLAISEKMRSQIRGLNMATKNSQDAISLVQTAEGALQETHSMLQRMNELANQSSTGTNQELDRNALAKEFDQLKREINDVAEQTTFNNMKILDGSLSYAGAQRSAATSGIVATETVSAADNTMMTSEITTKGQAEVIATAAVYDLNIADADLGALTDGASYTISIGGGTLTFKAGATAGDTRTAINTAWNAVANTDPILNKYTASTNGTNLRLTAKTADADANRSAIMGGAQLNAKAYATTESTKGLAAVAEAAGVTTSKVDVKNLKLGDRISVGGRTFELIAQGDTAADGNVGIEWDSNKTLANLVTGLNHVADVTVAATAAGDGFTVRQNAAGTGEYGVKFTAAAAVKTTLEFDTVKLKTGDMISVESNGTAYTYEFQQGDSITNIAQGLKDVDGNVLNATRKGSALIIEGKVDTSGFKAVTPSADSFNAMRIQIGALEGEQLSLSIDSMNTKGLALDDVSIYNQDTAGKAITATRTAVDKVSDQRAALGAMQNRLDHKIANLKVSSENLTAAESRIRDVDIASEMTSFTKSNILAQAATAMLAQANSLPQNVLSLLR